MVFGVSCCGNFITTIKVLCGVYQALSYSRRRLTQYQGLIISVTAIRALLAQLNLFIWDLSPDIGDSLRHCVASITESAAGFFSEMEGYGTGPPNPGPNPGAGPCSGDIRWEEKLEKLMNSAVKKFRDETNRQTTLGAFTLEKTEGKLRAKLSSKLRTRPSILNPEFSKTTSKAFTLSCKLSRKLQCKVGW